jgi:hypothetical protein
VRKFRSLSAPLTSSGLCLAGKIISSKLLKLLSRVGASDESGDDDQPSYKPHRHQLMFAMYSNSHSFKMPSLPEEGRCIARRAWA